MICYRDMTFCNEPTCCNLTCRRMLTEEVKQGAIKFGLPIAQGSFKQDCKYFVEKKDAEENNKT